MYGADPIYNGCDFLLRPWIGVSGATRMESSITAPCAAGRATRTRLPVIKAGRQARLRVAIG